MTPAQIQKMLETALAHHQAGRLPEADRLYRQVHAAAPRLFDPLHLAGVVAFQMGRFREAGDLLERALRLDPRSAICEMRLGLALASQGRHLEAEKRYRNSLRADPRMPESWNNLAVTLKALGKVPEALECYRKAIELRPAYHDAIDRLGALLSDTQGVSAGKPYFRKAVELKPDYAPGWCNLGLVLNAEGKFSEALECFGRALTADPKLVQAHVGRGLAFQQNYQLTEAIAAFDAALALDATYHEARSAKLLTLNYLSGRSREADFQEHLAFGQAAQRTVESSSPKPADNPKLKTQNPKLRIGFLSPDLRNHSILYFLEPLLRHLDRNRFELVLYHDHFQVDAGSARLRELASVWRNFVAQSHETVEATIRADKPDVLFDLASHTGINRLPLFARRLAPAQIAYLGYPNTTGLAAMDFRFVDSVTDPSDVDQQFHTEKLVRFAPTAWCYQPPASSPPPAERPATAPLTFGSFNNFAKVSDETLRLWANVLAAVPGARLLLKAHRLDDPLLVEAVRRRLDNASIAADRVTMLGRTADLSSHLNLYHDVDIALDSYPYHGTTTTCEALWMGVPVITLFGDRHASRVSGSLLTAIGHAEWIARSAEEYVEIAKRLAGDGELRRRLRVQLREDMRASPLMDHTGQAKRFGDAMVACWREVTEGRSVGSR